MIVIAFWYSIKFSTEFLLYNIDHHIQTYCFNYNNEYNNNMNVNYNNNKNSFTHQVLLGDLNLSSHNFELFNYNYCFIFPSICNNDVFNVIAFSNYSNFVISKQYFSKYNNSYNKIKSSVIRKNIYFSYACFIPLRHIKKNVVL